MVESLKRCVKCILPENYTGIYFNDEGICNFCLNYKKHDKYLGRESLTQLMQSAKKTSGYDCVVPLSGGKDSTYILYYVVKELKLIPLAVNYNSGFQSEIARDNIENACEALNVKLVIKKTQENIQKALIRQAIVISQIVGTFVGRTCGNCEVLLRAVSLNVAKEYGIPFVMWGSSPQESSDDSVYKKYRFTNKGAFNDFVKKISKFNLKPGQIFKLVIPLIKYNLLSICQRFQMGVPLKYALNPLSILPFSTKGIKYIHFFDYIEWDSIKEMAVLKDFLKWRNPEGQESRFDCTLRCFSNYSHLQRTGITSDGSNYCNFIREGKISREFALEKEMYLQKTVKQECEMVIREKLSIKKYKMPNLK